MTIQTQSEQKLVKKASVKGLWPDTIVVRSGAKPRSVGQSQCIR